MAVVVGILAFIGAMVIGSIAMSILATLHPLFVVMFRLSPGRIVANMVLAFAAAWLGFSVFDALA